MLTVPSPGNRTGRPASFALAMLMWPTMIGISFTMSLTEVWKLSRFTCIFSYVDPNAVD